MSSHDNIPSAEQRRVVIQARIDAWLDTETDSLGLDFGHHGVQTQIKDVLTSLKVLQKLNESDVVLDDPDLLSEFLHEMLPKGIEKLEQAANTLEEASMTLHHIKKRQNQIN